MCVVQKYRFQYKYTRYQQDLIRMKELQEEYLFLNRTDVYKRQGYHYGFEQKTKVYIVGAILFWAAGIDVIVRLVSAK